MDFTYDGGNRGEMQVTESVLRDGRIIFTTLIPNDQMCSFGGSGWLMELDAANGGRLDWAVFDLNNDGIFTAYDWVENGSLPDGSSDDDDSSDDDSSDDHSDDHSDDSSDDHSDESYSDNSEAEYEGKTSVSGTKSNSIPSQPRVTQSKNKEYTILNDTSGDIINMNTNAGRQISGRLNWRQLR
ncbi:MAG: hypothetical protein L3J62_10375, partial [Gammaproteobacteria bacterium]|nr:hypothetical protein [Gammaproteobacteria bacterium]